LAFDMIQRAGNAKRTRRIALPILLGMAILSSALGTAQNAPPLDTTPPVPPPQAPGITVLFDGTPDSMVKNWLQKGKPAAWKIENGAMVATGSDLTSQEKYTDFQLHIEFRVPYMPDKKGQARGNSGVYLQGRYEIQILDSYGIREPGSGDCGAVYSRTAPLVNACKPPLQWQTYDISFRAPRFDTTTHAMLSPARVTVLQNGLIVQNGQEIPGLTHQTKPRKPAPVDPNAPADTAKKPEAPPTPTEDFSTPGPIRLQYHGNTVAFRNIWILPLPPQGATHYEPR
jgi:hypothetical protein